MKEAFLSKSFVVGSPIEIVSHVPYRLFRDRLPIHNSGSNSEFIFKTLLCDCLVWRGVAWCGVDWIVLDWIGRSGSGSGSGSGSTW